MSPDVCLKCGRKHPRCKGHRRDGAPCGRGKAANQDVCRLHGGASPQAIAEARTRAVERAAEAELRKRWQPAEEGPIREPLEELARVAGEVVAFKDYLRDQVADLDGILSYWTDREFPVGEEEIRTEATEQLRAVVVAYERALDRSAKVLAGMVKLDLQGRLLELRTAQAEAIVGAVKYGLGQVDLSAEVRRAAQTAIAEAISALSQPQPREISSAS